MTDHIKEPHTNIFTGPIGCGKSHLVLDLIAKNTANILTILSPSAQYFNGIRHIILKTGSKKAWLVEPKDSLFQWIEKLPQLLARSETLFIVDGIIADEGLDKRR